MRNLCILRPLTGLRGRRCGPGGERARFCRGHGSWRQWHENSEAFPIPAQDSIPLVADPLCTAPPPCGELMLTFERGDEESPESPHWERRFKPTETPSMPDGSLNDQCPWDAAAADVVNRCTKAAASGSGVVTNSITGSTGARRGRDFISTAGPHRRERTTDTELRRPSEVLLKRSYRMRVGDQALRIALSPHPSEGLRPAWERAAGFRACCGEGEPPGGAARAEAADPVDHGSARRADTGPSIDGVCCGCRGCGAVACHVRSQRDKREGGW